MPTLTVAELLAFEERWGRAPKSRASKLEACYSELGVPPARYYQLLGRAIESSEALGLNPMLVHRLWRDREQRLSRQRRRVS